MPTFFTIARSRRRSGPPVICAGRADCAGTVGLQVQPVCGGALGRAPTCAPRCAAGRDRGAGMVRLRQHLFGTLQRSGRSSRRRRKPPYGNRIRAELFSRLQAAMKASLRRGLKNLITAVSGRSSFRPRNDCFMRPTSPGIADRMTQRRAVVDFCSQKEQRGPQIRNHAFETQDALNFPQPDGTSICQRHGDFCIAYGVDYECVAYRIVHKFSTVHFPLPARTGVSIISYRCVVIIFNG